MSGKWLKKKKQKKNYPQLLVAWGEIIQIQKQRCPLFKFVIINIYCVSFDMCFLLSCSLAKGVNIKDQSLVFFL